MRRGGVAGVSIGDVAAEAGVSKALVHYHFVDKDSLLAALVDDVGRGVVARARDRSALEQAERPLDAYWAWLERELREGDIRVLVSLADCESEATRAASRRVAEERRVLASEQVEVIFRRLAVSPRMPPGLVAETLLAFVDGLVCRQALDAVREPRGAFDILWLALLTLAE